MLLCLLAALTACAAPPPAKPVPTDFPPIFGKAAAPVKVVAWVDLRSAASIAFVKDMLPALQKGPVASGKAQLWVQPVSVLDGTLPAVQVLWCVQNTFPGNEAQRSAATIGLLEAMQASPPNGSPDYGATWWLRAVAIKAGLDPDQEVGAMADERAGVAVRKAYLEGKGDALNGRLTSLAVRVAKEIVNPVHPDQMTLKQIQAAIDKAAG
jgi:hypothetical protein